MSNSTPRPRWYFVVALAVLSLLCRLAPQLMVRLESTGYDMLMLTYPWGFTPLLAVGMFSGAFLTDRRLAIGLILGTQLLGDIGIWALSGDFQQGFDPGIIGVYLAYPICVVLGRALSDHRSLGRVLTGSVLAATSFFLVTNFGVWALGRITSPELATLYPLTMGGLIKCYTMGLPFAKEFISTPLFSVLLFSPLGISKSATPSCDKAGTDMTANATA